MSPTSFSLLLDVVSEAFLSQLTLVKNAVKFLVSNPTTRDIYGGNIRNPLLECQMILHFAARGLYGDDTMRICNS